MSNRELLEFAAKAAGYANAKYQDLRGWGEVRYGLAEAIWTGEGYWNPLADDGDALRLAVKLRMCILVRTFPHSIVVEAYNGEMPSATEALEDVRFDVNSPLAATRRAIVRAAAEIGRQMP